MKEPARFSAKSTAFPVVPLIPEALADLQALGLSEHDAKQVINAVYLKKVRHISISY